MLLGAIALWGVWGVAEKAAVARAHVYTVQWLYALPYLVALPIWYWLSTRAGGPALTARAASYAIGGSVASMVALLLLLLALRDRSASVVVAATSAYPAVTLLIAVAIGQEALSVVKLLGIGLVIGGVILLQVAK